MYKRQAKPEKSRFPAVIVPAWMPCPDCDDMLCVLHGEHVADCPCPDIDTWTAEGLFPYAPSVVRFLTPQECELLQGFPSGWTDVGLSDTRRYMALGNAVCVPVARWIAERIVALESSEV